jgi:iron complex transport system ATP-binding protein
VIRLEARNLDLRAAERKLCADLSFTVRAGENWVVLGPNGSGKTTLLHTLAGLRAPQGGEVWLDGQPISRIAARRRARMLALLFQDSERALSGNVLETVLTGRHPHLGALDWETDRDREIALSALAAVGLEGFAQRTLATLSGGERRRVDIAAVLTQQAPVCLYDEPTLHLDLRYQVEILARLAARATLPGHAGVFVLHDPYLASRAGTHALLLFAEGAHEQGPLGEVLTRANLERLYGLSLHEVRAGDNAVFLPR